MEAPFPTAELREAIARVIDPTLGSAVAESGGTALPKSDSAEGH
jgi:hypothetical protein